MTNKSGIEAQPTGFTDLDNLIKGFNPGDLIVLASHPASGKTSFALSILCHFSAVSDKAALVFSLEIPAHQYAMRMLECEVGESINIFKSDPYDHCKSANIFTAAKKISDRKIYIDDSPVLTISQIRDKARITDDKMPLGLIIIDYLQLVNSDLSGTRNEQIQNNMREIKHMAQELHSPVLLLAMMKNEEKTPELFDLVTTGNMWQAADIVIFLQRTGSFFKNNAGELVNIIVAKNLNNMPGTIQLLFKKEFSSFAECP